MKMNKILSCLALLVSFVLLLSSCSSHKPSSEPETGGLQTLESEEIITQTSEPSSYDQILSKRIEKDFQGKSFRIATDNVELVLADAGESLLGKEHYLRNSAIEKKYNVKIVLTDESGLPTVGDRIKTEALAGNSYCDLILLETPSFQSLVSSKSLINVRSIPYLDINADFYFERSLRATTQGNISYGISGDFIYNPEDIQVVFFNKTLLSQAPLPDIYSLVETNQWDMENFLLYSEEIFSLARANGTNEYGTLSTNTQEDLIKIFWAATGMDFLKNEYDSRPQLIYNSEETLNFIDQFSNHFIRSSAFSTVHIQESATTAFGSGDSLFLIAPLSTAKELAGKGVDWGIAPLPKLDINQKNYYSYGDPSYAMAGFAKGTEDLNFSGIITSALFATSKGMNQKFAIQTYLNLYLSTLEDAKMMERAISSPYFDPAEFFGQIDTSYTAATQTLLYRTAFNGQDFNELYDQYSKMLNKYLDTII